MTKQTFSVPCCRCGFCCLHECCPIILRVVKGLKKHDRCPALSFKGDVAVCGLAEHLSEDKKYKMGIGMGCCIKATAYGRDGSKQDFSGMPDFMKLKIAKQRRLR